MVTSADGGTSVEGRSGALGTPADHAIFHALRGVADVILAGAGTVRAERYGPPRTAAAVQARRVARGQQADPRLAVLTGRLELDFTSSLFTDSPTRPIVITTAAAARDRGAAAAEVADVLVTGETTVDIEAALRELRTGGVERVTCEGGPTLNSALLEADAIDEWCLSLAPSLIAGPSTRAAVGPTDHRRAFTMDRVLLDDDMLFLRYLRS
jgi:riboflavin biosynthesis pyrimidine reductase